MKDKKKFMGLVMGEVRIRQREQHKEKFGERGAFRNSMRFGTVKYTEVQNGMMRTKAEKRSSKLHHATRRLS